MGNWEIITSPFFFFLRSQQLEVAEQRSFFLLINRGVLALCVHVHVCTRTCVRVSVYLVGVPQSDCAAQRQLSHQKVVHPAEGKLQVLHLVLLHVAVHRLCQNNVLD